MTDPTSDLIERLGADDFNDRAKALAALVAQGRAAGPELTSALDSRDDRVRVQVAQALAEIADPSTADALVAAVSDPNADVRGHAAAGLARMGDERAIDAMVRTIDDLPDIEHYPYTSSVHELISLGPQVLPAVAPLLSAQDAVTRHRAFVVVQSVVSLLEADWDALWDRLGRYDPYGPRADRDEAAALWAEWTREQA